MGTPYLGEIRLLSFNFAPKNWALCNGQLLPINQNQALFALLGTTYGGDGIRTFALPNLQSRVPIHFGQGAGLSLYNEGQTGGQENHTLTLSEMPAHSHAVSCDSNTGSQISPNQNLFPAASAANDNAYSPSTSAAMAPNMIGPSGSDQPHTNIQPYLCLSYCIALQGIFPSQN